MRIAFFGGVYSNHPALAAAIDDAKKRGAEALYCLGDLGGFGPHPERLFELLQQSGVVCVQGNYDHSIGNDLHDCQCGYTDPRDNYFAQKSYDYTYENTGPPFRRWLRDLPAELRFEEDGVRFLLCHGSPRRTNEFLWESTTSTHFLDKLADDFHADLILGTHTGIHWQRTLSRGGRFINVGVLGRPENDGTPRVWYTMIRSGADADPIRAADAAAPSDGRHARHEQHDSTQRGRGSPAHSARVAEGGVEPRRLPVAVDFIPLQYDHQRLAREMRAERLPEEFVETILSGWWTTCLEVLPAKERRRGRF